MSLGCVPKVPFSFASLQKCPSPLPNHQILPVLLLWSAAVLDQVQVFCLGYRQGLHKPHQQICYDVAKLILHEVQDRIFFLQEGVGLSKNGQCVAQEKGIELWRWALQESVGPHSSVIRVSFLKLLQQRKPEGNPISQWGDSHCLLGTANVLVHA